MTSPFLRRFRQRVTAGRDAYVAGGDIHIHGAHGPTFTVEAPFDHQPPSLAELRALHEQPSTLLHARRQAITFTGRTTELAKIQSWCDGPAPRAVWVIHAAGGQGKTRLAARAAAQAAEAGWTVGYTRHRDDSPAGGHRLSVQQEEPLLLIVDYAERWSQSDLHTLLRHQAGHGGRLRVLLLARSIDWWPVVAAECDNLGITIDQDRRPPMLLRSLADDEAGRRKLFDAACHRFAEIYEVDLPPTLAPAGGLSDPVYGLTLSLHMAALAAVDAYARGVDRHVARPTCPGIWWTGNAATGAGCTASRTFARPHGRSSSPRSPDRTR